MYGVGQKTSGVSAQSAKRDLARVVSSNQRDIEQMGKVESGKLSAASGSGITSGLSKAREQIEIGMAVATKAEEERQAGVGQISKIANEQTKFSNNTYLNTMNQVRTIAEETNRMNTQLEAQKLQAYSELQGILAQSVPTQSDFGKFLNVFSGVSSGMSSGASMYNTYNSVFGP
jgi:hypothetical protein